MARYETVTAHTSHSFNTQHTPYVIITCLSQHLCLSHPLYSQAHASFTAWRGRDGALPRQSISGRHERSFHRPVLRRPPTHLPHQPRQYLHSAPSRYSCLASPPGLGEYLLLFGCFRDQLFSWKTPKLAVDLPSAPIPLAHTSSHSTFFTPPRPVLTLSPSHYLCNILLSSLINYSLAII